ncbi:MAG TPA: hypothetical protein VMG12_40320, partial [Polyangiaceae bacterium]|nr:hypothetical protein [Polyangiaceae bacterium]
MLGASVALGATSGDADFVRRFFALAVATREAFFAAGLGGFDELDGVAGAPNDEAGAVVRTCRGVSPARG